MQPAMRQGVLRSPRRPAAGDGTSRPRAAPPSVSRARQLAQQGTAAQGGVSAHPMHGLSEAARCGATRLERERGQCATLSPSVYGMRFMRSSHVMAAPELLTRAACRSSGRGAHCQCGAAHEATPAQAHAAPPAHSAPLACSCRIFSCTSCSEAVMAMRAKVDAPVVSVAPRMLCGPGHSNRAQARTHTTSDAPGSWALAPPRCRNSCTPTPGHACRCRRVAGGGAATHPCHSPRGHVHVQLLARLLQHLPRSKACRSTAARSHATRAPKSGPAATVRAARPARARLHARRLAREAGLACRRRASQTKAARTSLPPHAKAGGISKRRQQEGKGGTCSVARVRSMPGRAAWSHVSADSRSGPPG